MASSTHQHFGSGNSPPRFCQNKSLLLHCKRERNGVRDALIETDQKSDRFCTSEVSKMQIKTRQNVCLTIPSSVFSVFIKAEDETEGFFFKSLPGSNLQNCYIVRSALITQVFGALLQINLFSISNISRLVACLHCKQKKIAYANFTCKSAGSYKESDDILLCSEDVANRVQWEQIKLSKPQATSEFSRRLRRKALEFLCINPEF